MNLQTLTTSTSQEQQTPAAARVVLTSVSWHFKGLLADIGDNRACRLAYNQGILEIMAPYQEHEAPKIMIGSFVKALADELNHRLQRACCPDTNSIFVQSYSRAPLLPCPQLSLFHVSIGCSAITFSIATCVAPAEPSIQTLSVQVTLSRRRLAAWI